MNTLYPGLAGAVRVDTGLRSFINKVFAYMTAGLLVTAVSSYFSASFPFITVGADGRSQLSMLFWVALAAEFLLVFFIGGISRRHTRVGAVMFFIYAALTGFTLAPVLMQYTATSLTQVFVITAAVFGGAALYGATTRRNLTGLGAFMFMGLLGLILVMIVNLFLGSAPLDYAISVIGVIIFVGLTAYDMQKLEELYRMPGNNAILGALGLYLDFLNLFLFFLRLFGGFRD